MEKPAAPRKTLIVGLGNPLSGDDCFGSQVLERLRPKAAVLYPGVLLADAHTDLLNQIGNFINYNRVLLVDAILDPEGRLGRPGRILVLEEELFPPRSETSQGIHQLSPLLTVELFRVLYPMAETKFTLVGLLVDRIDWIPRYVTVESVAAGAAAVLALLA